MKKYIFAFASVIISTMAWAQGTLPMFYDFTTVAPAPTGWTLYQSVVNGNLTYTTAAFVKSNPNALRLDGSGEYAMANWSGRADTVTYWLSGTAAAGVTAWQGTFTIDESADGTAWTTIKTHTNDLGVTTNMYTVKVSSAARFVRFLLKTKVSGFNSALDDVTIKPAAATDAPELQVAYNFKRVISGSTVKTGTDTIINLTCRNNSKSGTLSISDIKLSGAESSNFSVLNSTPVSIAANDSANIQIKLNASVSTGTHLVTVTLTSNDTLNNPFIVNLSTIKGSYATEPTSQGTGLQLTTKAWRMTGKFTAASNVESYLVLCSKGSSTDIPQDGKEYERGQYIGNSRVVSVGSTVSGIDFDNIIANTSYTVRVFSYNGYGAYTNYLINTPLNQTVTTPGLNAAGTWSTVSSSDTDIVAKIRAITRPHRQIYYSNFATYIIKDFEARDTVGGKQIMNCFYSGYTYSFTPPFKFDTMSREHCYPSSWMGEASQDSANYSDLHILYPVHQNKVNAVRSNYPMNNLMTVTSSFYGGKFGRDSAGEFAYEPRDFAKGILARANFYVCATYNRPGKAFTIPTDNTFLGMNQDQNVLKRWNKQFPPNNWEIARHEYIAQSGVQGNRNPFIDNPDWACYIDFSDMSYIPGGYCGEKNQSAVNKPSKSVDLTIYPNPSTDHVTVNLKPFKGQKVTIYAMDFYERTVAEITTTKEEFTLDTRNWASGNYLILVRGENGLTGAQNLVK